MYDWYSFKINEKNFKFFTPLGDNNYNLDDVKQVVKFEDLISLMMAANFVYRRGFEGTPILDTISSHMYRLAFYSNYLIHKLNLKLDVQKCMTYSLVHDISEVYTGDTTPNDNVNCAYRNAVEVKIFEKIFKNEYIYQFYKDYYSRADQESKLVHLLDKFDFYLMLLPVKEEAQKYPGILEKIESCHISLKNEEVVIVNGVNVNKFLLNLDENLLTRKIDRIVK